MIKLKFTVLLASLLLFSHRHLKCQMLITKNYAIDLAGDTTRAYTFLDQSYFMAEMGRGFGSEEEVLAWNIKFGGGVEFYKWPKASLGFTVLNELIANPHNELGFNPRSVFWNETLYFQRSLRNLTFEIGVTHRCRHNVDNNEPANRKIERTQPYIPESRIMVFNSFHGSVYSHEIGETIRHRFWSRLDYYIYTEDFRKPNNELSPDFETMGASLFLGHRFQFETKNILFFGRNWINPVLFRESEMLRSNFRFELGAQLKGVKAHAGIFIAYEKYFDTLTGVEPLRSGVIFVGIRGNSSNVF
mgnify:CR=1 FL=1